MAPQKQRNSQVNIIVVAVIALVAGVVLSYIALPLLTQQLQGTNGSPTGVVYKVEGTAEQAVITYTEPDGRISAPKGVDLPWTSTMNIKPSTIVVLTAAAVGDGTIRCTILVGGRVLDTNMADPFIDKAICGGMIK